MIKINEFRIGNNIKEGIIDKIDNCYNEVYFSEDDCYLSDNCDNLNTIILNEEIILNTGFRYVKHKLQDYFLKSNYVLRENYYYKGWSFNDFDGGFFAI